VDKPTDTGKAAEEDDIDALIHETDKIKKLADNGAAIVNDLAHIMDSIREAAADEDEESGNKNDDD
jgi:hypothetical protein